MVRSLADRSAERTTTRPPRPHRKRSTRYHHGDLRRALVAEALRTIDAYGIERLTLRRVGTTLGVSRTALYRHFADKSALLAAVAREGFHTLRLQLVDAWERCGRGRAGFDAMGVAYMRFAIAHPSHYRVMFGGFVEACAKDDELVAEASAAFQVLVDALVSQQQASLIVRDDPQLLAQFIWAVVHGVAMLAIDGQLRDQDAGAERLIQYASERIRSSLDTVKA
jgi:AcrR family transcriptional regulator